VSDPIAGLVTALESRMNNLASRAVSGLSPELGVITVAGLKLDSFPYALPDYGVAEWSVQVRLPARTVVGTMTAPVNADGEPLPGASTSQLTRFDLAESETAEVQLTMQGQLQPGDRVLAVPIDGGNQAIVICKVVNAGG